MTLGVEKGAGRLGSLPWSTGSSAVRASSVGVERKKSARIHRSEDFLSPQSVQSKKLDDAVLRLCS